MWRGDGEGEGEAVVELIGKEHRLDVNGDDRCEDFEIAMFVSWMNWLVL